METLSDKSINRDRVIKVLKDNAVSIFSESNAVIIWDSNFGEIADAICKEPLEDNDKVIANPISCGNVRCQHCEEYKCEYTSIELDSKGMCQCEYIT